MLALVVAGVFAFLLHALEAARDSADLARHSQSVLATTSQLERFVIDLETGQRGFVITGEERFLDPWKAAQAAIPEVSRELNRLTIVPAQNGRARELTDAVASYIADYSVPLVDAARRGDASARSGEAIDEGKRRVDALRVQFDGLVGAEEQLGAARQDRSDASAHRAVIAASVGLGGLVLLIVVFAGYLTRAIVRPVRRAAAVADQLASGHLSVRMPEAGSAEIGVLERSFNTMGNSLEASREALRLRAEEQAALRRVATLVARGVSESAIFDAVVAEVFQVLGADAAHLLRYEPDGTVSVAGTRGGPDPETVGTRLPLEAQSIAASVLRTGRVARADSVEGVSSMPETGPREMAIRSSVGGPVVVGGRLWGVMIAVWTQTAAPPVGTEARMAEFTELLATAIANADSRAELIASRARVVAAADETRRRIERDLHDGTQQRLVSLALELRAAETAVPPESEQLKAQLARTASGLAEVVEDLQEVSRGIHPAILSKGGLAPAIKTLARRSAVPVELDVRVDRRLPDAVEVAAYFVVSEALTNVAKHAQATVVTIDLEADDAVVRVSICDDGVGGADPGHGSGLVGLRDRVEALGGTIDLASTAGGGTSVFVRIPIEEQS
jgi:signal transduction histidine kinase